MITVWETNDGEHVAVGDLVAIRSLAHPDAVGRIVGPLPDDRIECHVTRTVSGPTDFNLPVYEYQLLCRIPEGGDDQRCTAIISLRPWQRP
jgi:hypothetical protein